MGKTINLYIYLNNERESKYESKKEEINTKARELIKKEIDAIQTEPKV